MKPIVVAIASLLLMPGAASALALTKICDSGAAFTIKQKGNNVEIRCPNQLPELRLTILGCLGATGIRDKATGVITLRCAPGSSFVELSSR